MTLFLGDTDEELSHQETGGNDIIFAQAETAFYLGEGDVDHAAIFDFSLLDGDLIFLNGSAEDYILQNFVVDETLFGVYIIRADGNDLVSSVVGQTTDNFSFSATPEAFTFAV